MKFFSYIFRKFLPRVEYERNSKLNFFFLFFGLSDIVLAKNNARRRFFNFFDFFSTFFGNLLFRSSMNGIQDKIFFLYFLVHVIPFWLKIMLERDFLIFWIFLLFFSEFSCPGRVWMEFGTKIFFLSFSAYPIPFRL